MLLRHARSNAVGYVALMVALGGTSYAAVKPPAHSVGPKQLKANAVTSVKVKNHTLRLKDFKVGQIPAGPAGERGPAGADGANGATGAVGPTYASQSAPFSQVIPSTTVESTAATQTLSLPTAGRVFVYGHARREHHVFCGQPGDRRCTSTASAFPEAPGGSRRISPTWCSTSPVSPMPWQRAIGCSRWGSTAPPGTWAAAAR